MAARPALPERYQVDRIGTPDPSNSQYFVLDIVNDQYAREVLAKLGRYYQDTGKNIRAEECWAALDQSKEAFQQTFEVRNAKGGKAKKATSS